jgi:hypothetical protein
MNDTGIKTAAAVIGMIIKSGSVIGRNTFSQARKYVLEIGD